MMKLLKDPKVLIGIALVFVLLGGGGYYVATKSSTSSITPTPEAPEEVVPTISPDDLGLTFTLRRDKKAARFEIENASDIEAVEYQITYTKEIDGEEVPEGLYGEAKPENGKISIDDRIFGTCSSGVCRYDKVVSDIKLILKITKTNGKVYSSETSVSL